MKKKGILIIGSVNMDLVVRINRFPNRGETILSKNFQMFPGGKGANQAVCCAKLGARTSFIGKIGRDQFGEKLNISMRNNGVYLDNLIIDEKLNTGIAIITVDDSGQNEIIVVSGSNMNLLPEEISNRKKFFTETSVVLSQLEIPIETVIKTAEFSNENNVFFILNPAPACKLPEKLLKRIDFLTPNETELELLSGISVKDIKTTEEAAKSLLKKGVKNIIVTLGAKGAFYVSNDYAELFPAYKVNAVDSTAAGDAFNGAFAFALSNGESISDAINFANKVASISVTRMGAQSSMPDKDELKQFVSV